MRKGLVFKVAAWMLMLSVALSAQAQQPLKVTTSHLKNGMKLVIVEEHSAPKVYGTVYVHVGSKNDPLDATGMAHYFEHIMFKGTDSIGTINWAKEKPILDSIEHLYDVLHDETDPTKRQQMQMRINDLTLASSQYAIPNEVSSIVASMGGTRLNAGTGYDMTQYLNDFPANQLEKWMQLYAERFRNPVFRLFQGELEAVYEEKNMYADGPMQGFVEEMFRDAFGEHPYGRPIVGYTEHLKNPQPSRMHDFYNTYYVANNMTLIMVGDVNPAEVQAIAERTFGKLKSGNVPQPPTYTLPVFKAGDVKEVKLTPIKLGILMWRGVPNNHEDATYLEVLSSILSNGGSGLLDKLMVEQKLLGIQPMLLSLEDGGMNAFLYIPKLVGQKHEEAEQLILACIDSLRTGNFSEELLDIAKMDYVVMQQSLLEDIHSIADIFTQLETTGKTYEEWLADLEKVRHMTKADLMRVANKYLNNDFLALRSSMGFPEKDKVEKPNWKPLESHNANAKSAYAQRLSKIPVIETKAQVVDFDRDVKTTKINEAFSLYSAPNPVNQLSNISIHYSYSTYHDADLDRAVDYWNMLGANEKDFVAFNSQLQRLGATMDLSTDKDESILTITAFDADLPTVINLVAQKVANPRNDEKQIKGIIDGLQSERQMFGSNAEAWSQALVTYVMFGQQSEYLRRTPIKEWSKRSGEDLIAEVNQIFQYDGYVTYTGNADPTQLARQLEASGLVKEQSIHGIVPSRRRQVYDESQVFIVNNKRMNQSNIYFVTPGEVLGLRDRSVSNIFNKYYGHDMYSIIFQEIREFRSLGYTAYATVSADPRRRDKSALVGYLGTQSDKTIDGITAMTDLMKELPVRPDNFRTAQQALILSQECDYIQFRSLPNTMKTWRDAGYTSDPRQEMLSVIKNATMEDIEQFFNSNIKGRPISIIMVGNTKRFNAKDLAKFGKITELKEEDIIVW